jgi:NADPH:quinone reductase-like Zn-dependent oxidoreductase
LINGASGGIGPFAVQIAKAFGAEVTGVCSTRNLELVRSIGADHVIDYKNEDYTQLGERYDLIIDMVGNHSLMENRAVLSQYGRLVIIGGPAGKWLGPMTRPAMAKLISPFIDQDLSMMIARLKQDDLALIGQMMVEGKVKPVIDQHFTLSEVPAAIEYSEDGHARGKILIDVEE